MLSAPGHRDVLKSRSGLLFTPVVTDSVHVGEHKLVPVASNWSGVYLEDGGVSIAHE